MKLDILTNEEVTRAILAKYPGTIPDMDIDYDSIRESNQAQAKLTLKQVVGLSTGDYGGGDGIVFIGFKVVDWQALKQLAGETK